MASKTIEQARAYFNDIADELNALKDMDTMEMYRRLTELGEELPGLKPDEQVPENFVQGCVSNVYVIAEYDDDGVALRGSSEALVVRGYVAVMALGLSGLSQEDFLQHSESLVEDFARSTDIRATLTPNRANAFGNIYKLMAIKVSQL